MTRTLVKVPLPLPDRLREQGRRLLASRWLALEFKLADCWVGAFWHVTDWWAPGPDKHGLRREIEVWICLVPMLPIHIHWVQFQGGLSGSSTTV